MVSVFVRTRLTGNDYSIFLLPAPTASDLDVRTVAFQKDAAACMRSTGKRSCAALMREVEVNPYTHLRINGVETDVPLGSTIRQIVKQAPIQQLVVLKPKGGKLFPVSRDRGTQDILALPLEGGEEIRF